MRFGHPDLCDLDEALLHQTPFPMRHASTSDVRFFDRYWLSAADPAGTAGLIAGIGYYKNTGSCDGYLAIQAGSRQYNARFARPLDEDRDAMTVGDVRILVEEPFRTIRLVVDPTSSPLAADLTWTSSFPVHLEAHHFDAPAGRTMQDMTRYDQIGRWHGWIDYGAGRIAVDDWWGARDHSWGVRPGVGGFEKSHGDPSMKADMPTAPRKSMLHLVLYAEAGDKFLALQYRENAEGKRLALDGELITSDGTRRRIGDLELDIDFVAGSRAYKHVKLDVTLEDDTTLAVEAEPLLHAWAYSGTGYDGGYRDRRGLGAWRGTVAEYDVYDYVPPEQVFLDGSPVRPGHREQPVTVSIDGVAGMGHCPVITRGSLPRRGID